MIDASHVVVFWNEALARMTGVAASEVLGTQDQWRAFYPSCRPVLADLVIDGAPPRLLEEFYGGKYRPSRHAPAGWEAEDFFPAFGPEGRWLAFSAAAIRDAGGQVIGCVETLQDITERKQAEFEQRAAERRLTEIVAGSPVATFVIDAQCRVTHWNRACQALTGIPAQEIIGRNDIWRAFYAFETRRVVLAELIVKGATAAEVRERYGDHGWPSRLVDGAFEGCDYFPALGNGGTYLHFMAAPLHDSAGNIDGAIETLLQVAQMPVGRTT